MKAVRFHEFGGPEVLRYEDVDRPRPAAAQVLIRVAATSFNPVDAAMRSGFLQQVFPVALPHTPGLDVAGTLAEIGEGVARWSVGYALQLAKQAGATVIATASPRSRDAVEALGADRIVDYTAAAVTEAISEPVEVVLN